MMNFYDSCIDSVKDHPILAVGVAAFVGLIAGLLLASVIS